MLVYLIALVLIRGGGYAADRLCLCVNLRHFPARGLGKDPLVQNSGIQISHVILHCKPSSRCVQGICQILIECTCGNSGRFEAGFLIPPFCTHAVYQVTLQRPVCTKAYLHLLFSFQ